MSIDVVRSAGIATLLVNAPERHNVLNSDALSEMLCAVQEIGRDEGIRAVILSGAGDRAFIAGANINEMVSKSRDDALEFGRLGHAVANQIERLPQPVIAAVNGFALGGGCELALACDIRHCSDNAVFAQPEVQLGIPPGWGGSQRLVRVVGPGYGAEMIYSGKRIDAEQALRIGLVNEVHPVDALMDKVTELARSIAEASPQAVRAAKRLIALGRGASAASSLAEELRTFAEQFGGDEQREGMTAFLEKRKPSFGQSNLEKSE